nr:SNF2-related protein [Candidatus Sigynarchaeota archaeon]
MTSLSATLVPFLPGMKVVVKNNTKLGVGDIFSVDQEPVLHYKVIFPSPPVKTLYHHELARLIIPDGALVQTRYGTGKIVKKIDNTTDEMYRYEIEFFKDKSTKALQESVITRVSRGIAADFDPATLVPADAMLVGWFLNAYYFRYCLPTDPRFQAVCHGRIEAFPHQIKVINQVLGNYPSRFLLCDEVGLGKTIEALAILKELSLQNIVNRVIIIVPANLVPQWKFELESKFNMEFTVYDGAFVKSLKVGYPGINPWSLYPRILTSLHFLRRDESRAAMKEMFFDMAIFDEAHHLRRYAGTKESFRKTKNYELGEIVCTQSRVVLLLTATPMQLNPFELFSLIQLLDPSLFPKYSNFLEFKEKISHYNLVLKNMDRFGRLNIFEKNYMLNMLGELLHDDARFSSPEAVQDALARGSQELKETIISSMRDRHLLSRILIRNKKRHVFHGFLPKRNTKIILVEPTKEELDIYKAIRLYITTVYQRALEEKNAATGFVMVVFQRLLASSHVALRKTIQQRVAKLREVQVTLLQQQAQVEAAAATMTEEECKKKLVALEKRIATIDQDVPMLNDYHAKLTALKQDSKASALVDLIMAIMRKERDVKIIVFTQFIRTLHYLKLVIESTIKEVEIGIFHGQLTKEEKDVQIDRFKSSAGKPFVLISTEAGGEGRNFQFCHNVINYDLPWNPMKLEQRIGRVDRIGQDHDVNVFNFALKDTVEENIVSILSERIYAFQEIVGELEPILVNFEDDIGTAILTSRTDEEIDFKFQLLGNKISEKLKHLQKQRTSMQDVILEMESKELMSDASLACNIELNYYQALKRYMFLLIGAVNGATASSLPDDVRDSIKTRLVGKGIGTIAIKEVKDNVYTIDEGVAGEHVGTFDRVTALKNERLEFFNLGHSFVEKLIDASLAIDVSKYIGVREETRDHFLSNFNDKRFKDLSDAASVVIICNGIDMSGVKSQHRLACEAFSITRAYGKNVAKSLGQVTTEALVDYMASNGEISTDMARLKVSLPSSEMLGGIMAINAKRVNETVANLRDDWKGQNDDLYEKMKAREQHYHAYRIKKYEDEIIQYKFMIAENADPDAIVDSKNLKAIDNKVAKAEEKIKHERELYEAIMREITENYHRLDVSSTPLGIIIILFKEG